MQVRLEIILVGTMTLLTLLTGLAQALLAAGLLSQDPTLIPCCAWIQGGVGALLFCIGYGLFALIQCVGFSGLILKKPWGWGLGLVLAALYTCSAFLPIGVLLFYRLLSERGRAPYRAATSSDTPTGEGI